MTQIADYVSGFYDGPHATPKEADSGPIFLGISNVTPEGRLDLSAIRHVSEEEFLRWTKRVKPQKDDIVFSYEATLHRYALIPEGFYGCLGRRMALIRPDVEKIVPRFLHYYMLSPLWRKEVEASIISGATVNRIPLTKVPSFKVCIPNKGSQQKIADILSAYDDLIENNRRRIALLEDAARHLYKEWFVRFRFPGHEHSRIVDGVPEGWLQCTLSDICSLRAGGTFKPEYQGQSIGDIPFIKVRDMNSLGNAISITEADNWVTETQCSSFRGKPFPIGTSVFAKIGEAIRKNRVRLIIAPTLIDNNMMGATPNNHGIPSAFLYLKLRTIDFGAMAGGAAVPFISSNNISNESVILPIPSLLESFDEVVAPIFDQIACLQKYTVTLTQARDLLLPKLMSGEIAV